MAMLIVDEKIRNSARNASLCAKCGRAVAPEETIVRRIVYCQVVNAWYELFPVRRLAAICLTCCNSSPRLYTPALACSGCSRRVYQEGDGRCGRVFCSEVCRMRYWNQLRSER